MLDWQTIESSATYQSLDDETKLKAKERFLAKQAQVDAIADTIKQVESGGDYRAQGKSGEFGAYQFRPETWGEWSKEHAGQELDVKDPESQDLIAKSQINKWVSKGYTPEQIASLWNSGTPEWEGKKGVNRQGVEYDVPGYVEKFKKTLGQSNGDETAFKQWYAERAKKTGLDPNPDDPRHKYDYRAAFKAGAEPEIADDGQYHWPSQFKADDHPNRFVDGKDTKTGGPIPWDVIATSKAYAALAPEQQAIAKERYTAKYATAQEGEERESNYLGAIGSTLLQGVEGLKHPIQAVGMDEYAKEFEGFYRGIAEKSPRIKRFQDDLKAGKVPFMEKAVGSIGPTAVGLAQAVIPYAGLPLATTYFYGMNAEEIFDTAKQMGASDDKAQQSARVGGAFSTLLDMAGIKMLSKVFMPAQALGRWLVTYLEGVGTEAGTEGVQQAISYLSSRFAAKPEGEDNKKFIKRMWDERSKIGAEMKEAAGIGGAVAAMTGGLGGTGIRNIPEIEVKEGKEEPVTEGIDEPPATEPAPEEPTAPTTNAQKMAQAKADQLMKVSEAKWYKPWMDALTPAQKMELARLHSRKGSPSGGRMLEDQTGEAQAGVTPSVEVDGTPTPNMGPTAFERLRGQLTGEKGRLVQPGSRSGGEVLESTPGTQQEGPSANVPTEPTTTPDMAPTPFERLRGRLTGEKGRMSTEPPQKAPETMEEAVQPVSEVVDQPRPPAEVKWKEAQGPEWNISHRMSNKGSHLIEAKDKSGNVIGKGIFVESGDNIKFEPGSILYVEPNYRRKGVATEIFRKAEEVTGKKITRGANETPTGVAFGDKWFGKKQPYENEEAIQPESEVMADGLQKGKGQGRTEGEVRKTKSNASPEITGLDSQITKNMPDGTASDIEFFSNLSKSDAFSNKGLSGLNVPTKRKVMSRMISALHKPEIFDSVVKSIPVDVVNKLISIKPSAKIGFHDKNMFRGDSFVDHKDAVSLRIDIANSLVSNIAGSTTKAVSTSSELRGESGDRLSTLSTGDIPSSPSEGFLAGRGATQQPGSAFFDKVGPSKELRTTDRAETSDLSRTLHMESPNVEKDISDTLNDVNTNVADERFPTEKVKTATTGKQEGLFGSTPKPGDSLDIEDKPEVKLAVAGPKVKINSRVRYSEPGDKWGRDGLEGIVEGRYNKGSWLIKFDNGQGIVASEKDLTVLGRQKVERPTEDENIEAVTKWGNSTYGSQYFERNAEPGERFYRVIWESKTEDIHPNTLNDVGLAENKSQFPDLRAVHITNEPEYWANKLQDDYGREGRYNIVEIEAIDGDAIAEDPQYAMPDEDGYKADSKILITSRKLFERQKKVKGKAVFLRAGEPGRFLWDFADPETPAQVQSLLDTADTIKAAISSVLPTEVMDRIEVQLKPRIDVKGRNIEKSLKEHGRTEISSEDVLGTMEIRDLEAIIEIAYRLDTDMEATALHEAYHLARDWMLPQAEIDHLSQAFESEEKEAEAFAMFAKGGKARMMQPGIKGRVKEIFNRLYNALRRIRLALQGKGFESTEDIFRSILGKQYAAHFGGTNGGTALTAEQQLTEEAKTENFKKWFGKSRVVDGRGNPLIQYHWTDYDFNEFDINATGGLIHFGTKRAAIDRAGGMANISYEVEEEDDGFWVFADSGPMQGDGQGPFKTKGEANAFIKKSPKTIDPMAVYLKIKNPLRTPDFGVWTMNAVREWMNREGIISDKEATEIWKAWQRSDRDGYEAFNKIVKKHGYDGFVYTNEQEDAGSDSYVVLSPTQIKSVFNRGTWSDKNPDIRLTAKDGEGTSFSVEGKADTPESAADRLGITYDGPWDMTIPGKPENIQHTFTDPKTGGTFTVKDIADLPTKLEEKRKEFAAPIKLSVKEPESATPKDILKKDSLPPEAEFIPGHKDVKWFRETFSLPHWIAKDFPQFAKFYDRQLNRIEERTQALTKSFKDVESFYNLKAKDLESVNEIVWKIDGKQVVETDKFVYKKDATSKEKAEAYEKHYQELEAYIRKTFPKASDEAITAILDVRRSLDKDLLTVYNVMADMREIPDVMLQKFRTSMGNIHNYFPHHRRGAYALVAKDKDGKVVYRTHFGIPGMSQGMVQLRSNKMVAKLNKDYPEAKWTWFKNKEMPEELFESPIPIEAVDQLITKSVENMQGDGQAKADLEKMLKESMSDLLKSRGWGSHMIHRSPTPIEGYEKDDIKRVLFDYKAGLNGWLTKMEASRDFSKFLGEINAHETPGLYRTSLKYMRNMLENDRAIDRAVGFVKGVFFIKFLGGNIKTAALNLTQNIISGVPTLSVHAKGAEFRYLGAMKSIVSLAQFSATGKVGKSGLKEDEQKMLASLFEQGVTQDVFMQELRGKVNTKAGNAWNKFTTFMGIPMSVAERFNRASLALAAYRAARNGDIVNKKTLEDFKIEKGEKADPAQAEAFAKMIVQDSHFVYGKPNQPGILRGSTAGKVASTAFTFRSFSVNLLSLWTNMLKNGPRGAGAFVKSMAGTALIGGLSSVAGYETIMALFRSMFGEDPEKELRKAIPEGPPGSRDLYRDLITYGLPSGFGVTLGGSMGMEVPVLTSALEQRGAGAIIGDILGVPYAMLWKEPGDAIEAVRARRWDRAIENMPITPIIVRNILAANRLEEEGMHTISGKPIARPGETQPRKLTEAEAWRKRFGFQNVQQQKDYQVYQSLKELHAYKDKKQTDLANSLANAMWQKDEKKRKAVISEIREWNDEQRKRGRLDLLIDIGQAMRSRMKASQPPKQQGRLVQEMKELY